MLFSVGKKVARRQRAVYSDAQLFVLEQHFQMSQYPNAYSREELAQKLSVSVERVAIWLKNRRAKQRRLRRQAQQ